MKYVQICASCFYPDRFLTHRTVIIAAGLLSAMAIISALLIYRGYRFNRDMNILLDGKVRERTSEIEREVGEIMRELKERVLQMMRIMQAAGETVKSFKGMCNIASQFVDGGDIRLYISKVGETIDRVEKIRALLPGGNDSLN